MVKNRTIHHSGCPYCAASERGDRLRVALLESAQANHNTLATLKHNLKSLRTLAKSTPSGSIHVKQAYLRMLYASVVTALETFLSDTFYRAVSSDRDLMERLLTTTPEFTERKYSISEIIAWEKQTLRRVEEFLFDIAWHNLGKVSLMYKSSLQVKFPEGITDLYKAVSVRHDIVHRNGRTKDNRVHHVSSVAIAELVNSVEEFAEGIARQVKEQTGGLSS